MERLYIYLLIGALVLALAGGGVFLFLKDKADKDAKAAKAVISRPAAAVARPAAVIARPAAAVSKPAAAVSKPAAAVSKPAAAVARPSPKKPAVVAVARPAAAVARPSPKKPAVVAVAKPFAAVAKPVAKKPAAIANCTGAKHGYPYWGFGIFNGGCCKYSVSNDPAQCKTWSQVREMVTKPVTNPPPKAVAVANCTGAKIGYPHWGWGPQYKGGCCRFSSSNDPAQCKTWSQIQEMLKPKTTVTGQVVNAVADAGETVKDVGGNVVEDVGGFFKDDVGGFFKDDVGGFFKGIFS